MATFLDGLSKLKWNGGGETVMHCKIYENQISYPNDKHILGNPSHWFHNALMNYVSVEKIMQLIEMLRF